MFGDCVSAVEEGGYDGGNGGWLAVEVDADDGLRRVLGDGIEPEPEFVFGSEGFEGGKQKLIIGFDESVELDAGFIEEWRAVEEFGGATCVDVLYYDAAVAFSGFHEAVDLLIERGERVARGVFGGVAWFWSCADSHGHGGEYPDEVWFEVAVGLNGKIAGKRGGVCAGGADINMEVEIEVISPTQGHFAAQG